MTGNSQGWSQQFIACRFLLDAAIRLIRIDVIYHILRVKSTAVVEHDRISLHVLEVSIDQRAAYQRGHVIVGLTGHLEGQRELDGIPALPFPFDDQEIACLR